MKILIVSATEKEIIPLINSLSAFSQPDMVGRFVYNKLFIDVLVTGVGSVFTTYHLSKKLFNNTYDLILNVGIAGSFNSDLQVGEIVLVSKDQFADLGIEDENAFSTLFEKGFIPMSAFPFTNGVLANPFTLVNSATKELKQVDAITVNTTHGKEETSNLFKEKFNADLETMEGAAFFYVCLQQKIPFLQLRAISNYVKPRKNASWNISLAIENLNKKLFELLVVLDSEHTI